MNKEESVALYQRGEGLWNEWATEVLARRDDSDEWKNESSVDFSFHAFGNANFSGFVFPGPANFTGTTFGGNSWFIGTKFEAGAKFKNAVFENEVCFIESSFGGDAWFEEAAFGGDAHFGKSTFRNTADFRKTTYRAIAAFSNSTFEDIVFFQDSSFSGYAMFNAITCNGSDSYFEATFAEGATFDNAVFKGNAHYRDARLEGSAMFAHVLFGGSSNFGDFLGTVRFENAIFEGEAWFAKSVFKKVGRFDSTIFRKAARFEQAVFEEDVAFNSARFEGYAIFNQTEYHGQVSFQAVEGMSAFTMTNASFSEVPHFVQATFAEAPRLDNFSITTSHRKGVLRTAIKHLVGRRRDPTTSEEWGRVKQQNKDMGVRWRTLRRLATQGQDHGRELMFFREEVLTSRWIDDKPWQAFFWFGVLYQLLSDFGRSVSRPLVSWVIWWLGFSIVYLFLGSNLSEVEVGDECESHRLRDPRIAALGLSLYRSLPVLSGLGDRLPEFNASLFGVGRGCSTLVPDSVLFLGAAQTTVSTVLLFLVLLGLRQRFRIR